VAVCLSVTFAAGTFLHGEANGAEAHIAAARDEKEASASTFDPPKTPRVLIRNTACKIEPIRPDEVSKLYGKPDGLVIRAEIGMAGSEKFVDVCSEEYAEWRRFRGALRPTFQDLSDSAGWPKVHVVPGALAIDPRFGRFKFYEGYPGRISLIRQVPTPHGNPFGLAAKGDYLFVGTGESAHGMLVIDAHDPSDMQVLAEAPRRGPWILDVKAFGDLVFSSDGGYVNIYDMKDPRKPKVLNHFPCGAKYMMADPGSNTIYHRGGDNQYLRRVDVSVPDKPKALPNWPMKYEEEISCWVYRLGHIGYAWVSVPLQPEEEREQARPPEAEAAAEKAEREDGTEEAQDPELLVDEEDAEFLSVLRTRKEKEKQERLKQIEKEKESVSSKKGFYNVTRVYDLRGDPAEPVLLGEMKPGHFITQLTEQDGKPFGLGGAPEPGIAVYDLSDVVHPRLVKVHPHVGGGWSLANGYLYACAGRPNGKEGGLRIYDFRDLLEPPKLVGRVNQFDRRYMEHRSRWSAPLVRGNHAFVLDYFFGVVAIDVSAKEHPKIVGGLHTAGEAFCLAVSDTRVFIGENMGGLTIIDSTDPSKARRVGNFGVGPGWGVAARDNIAFCANLGGLMIVDTTDPKNPVELSYVDDINHANAVKVVGDYAYCMGHAGYGDIIDISDVRKPVRLGRFKMRGSSFSFDVRGDLLYVADHKDGLLIYDISDRRKPTQIAAFKHGGGAGYVEVRGPFAFVAAPPGLQVVDVSDPRNPQLHAATRHGRAGTVVGDYIYAAAYSIGHSLFVTDISDLKHPKVLEGFKPGGYSYATECAVHGEYLYLASLPYLSICKGPMSSEAPRGFVSLTGATLPARESFASTDEVGDELENEAASLLPSRSQASNASPAAIHACLKRLETRDRDRSRELHQALSVASARLLGLQAALILRDDPVPGFATEATLSIRNQGTETLRLSTVSLISTDGRAQMHPVESVEERALEPGASFAATFRVLPGEQVRPGDTIALVGRYAYAYAGSAATVGETWTARARSPLTVFERIPRLDVTNLDPTSFSFKVRNNTAEPRDLCASLGLPKGWIAMPGARQTARIPGKGTKRFSFALQLPDAPAQLGEVVVPLSLSADETVLYSRKIDALATREMRWRVMGSFGFDVTSKKRPIPEREVVFEKTYHGGRRAWKPYRCRESARINLHLEGTTHPSSGSVLMFYGATYIRSDRARSVKFSLLADGVMRSGPKQIVAWLNGRQVLGEKISLVLTSKEQFDSLDAEAGKDRALLVEDEMDRGDAGPPRLKEGWNLLLVRVCWINNWRFIGYYARTRPQWLFRLQLRDDKGHLIENLTFDSEKAHESRGK